MVIPPSFSYFEESIISGASIFYGSVSNAVIGEAKVVWDQGDLQLVDDRFGTL